MNYTPLQHALEDWFDKPLEMLPPLIQKRVNEEPLLVAWNLLHSEQRQSQAQAADYLNDPQLFSHRNFWFVFLNKVKSKEAELAKWRQMTAQTLAEIPAIEDCIAAIDAEILDLKKLELYWISTGFPQHEATGTDQNLPSPTPSSKFLGFPRALRLLQERIDTNPYEFAAWIYQGPAHGGIRAYKTPIVDGFPMRFFYEPTMNPDYITEVHFCQFLEEELSNFQPSERFITGETLIDRWVKQLKSHAKAWINKFMVEGRLIGLHPTRGAVSIDGTEDGTWQKLEKGLFPLSQVMELGSTVIDVEYPPAIREQPAARKTRLEMMVEDETRLRGKKGAKKRTAEREGISVPTLSNILSRPKKN